MIHEILTLDRPLICVDTETTSTNTMEGRIVEIGFQLYDHTGLKNEWSTLVQPGVPIPPDAMAVHGITEERLVGCRVCGQPKEEHVLDGPTGECAGFKPWPKFSDIAPSLARGFTGCDFAGKNIRFDLRMIASEMARNGVSWSYRDARILDVDRLEQIGRPRTLSHMCREYLHREPENAHQALADVQMTIEIMVAQLRVHRDRLPKTIDELHKMQWPGWIDSEGKFRFVNGVPTCTFGKYKDKPMSAIDRGYWSWMSKADFSDDIKQLALDAKNGKFPVWEGGQDAD